MATERTQKRAILIVGSLIGVVALILGIVIATDDDDDGDEVSSASSTSTFVDVSSTTTTAPASTTTTTIDAGDLDLAAYPDRRGDTRFDSPESLVEAFATELLGFDTSVVLGSFQQGDLRSGEIEISRRAGGAKTNVAVRQLADGAWVVVAASTESIVLDTPIPRTRISSPQPLIGAAAAFEGHVNVTLYADGDNVPIATSFVLGRGDGVLGDFTGSLPFTVPEGATHGVLVLSEPSAEDGTTHVATALRVRF